MKLHIVIFISLVLSVNVAFAERLSSNAVFCLSEESMKQLYIAVSRGDERGIREQFQRKVCYKISQQPEVSVLQYQSKGIVKIRIYWNDSSTTSAWTLEPYIE